VAGSFRIAEGYVEVTADESAYDTAMTRLKAKDHVVKVGIDVDDKDAIAKLDKLVKDRVVKISATADTRVAADELANLTRRRVVAVDTDLDEGGALSQLGALVTDRTVRLFVQVDDADAIARLTELTRDRMVNVLADADTRVAAADLANLTQRRTVRVDADADTAAARARLDDLTRDRHINVRVDMDRSVLGSLSSLGGGGESGSGGLKKLFSVLTNLKVVATGAAPMLASLGQAIIQMGPAAAIAVPAMLSLGAAFAAIKIGTSGIGDAFKQAFTPAVSSGNAAAASTKKVEAAQRSLAKAQQAVKDAEVNAAAARVKAARDIQDAQQSLKNTVSDVADANRRGAESVASAERDLADAQRAAKQAQLDLTQARKDAAQELEDLNARLADAQLDQRQKVLDLQDATQELAKVKAKGAAATQEEIDKAQLQYDKALQALAEQQTETQRLQDQTDQANAAGVEGSDKVTKAKQGIAAANQQVSDKTQSLTDAEIEAARTQEDGAQRIAKAQRDVADAQTAAAKAATDGARQIADAQEAAKEAAQAYADAQNSGAVATSKTADAMAKLAPNARAFVTAVIAQRAAWRGLKLDVQNALFAGLGQKFTTMSTAILPSLETGLTGTASVLNTMAKNAFDAVTNLGKTGQLRQMFDGLNNGLKPLARFPAQFITGLTQISIAASPAFQRINTAAGGMADTIAKKLSSAFASGRLEDSINTAVNVAKQFGQVIGDIFGTLGNVMKAAAAGGGNALGGLAAVFQELRKITAMPEVQKALTSIFTAVNSIAKLVAGTLGAVIQAVLPLLAALAPVVTQLATEFGPVLAQLAEALGKALMPIITALLPVVGDLGSLLVGLVQAVVPLLQPIGDLIGVLITALAPFLKLFASNLQTMVTALVQFLAPVITALVPVVQTFGQLFAQIAPLFAQLYPALLPLIPPLAQLTVALVNLAMQVITPLLPLIVGLAQLLTGTLSVAVGLLVPVINVVVGAITGFVNAMSAGVKAIVAGFQWLFDVLVGHSIIPDLVTAIVTWFTHLWSETKRIFNGLKTWLVNLWNSIWTSLRTRWNSFWSGLNSSIMGALRAVRDSFSSLKSSITNTWNSLWNGVNNKIIGIFSAINTKINNFKNGMKSAFSSLRDSLGTIWNGVKSKIGAPIKFVVDTVYNNGIRRMWNTIAGSISSKLTLPKISLGFNQGGIVPGAGNRDTVPAMLTPGERILSNQQVAKMGGHRAIDAALGDGPTQPRRQDRRKPVPEFGGGGIIGSVTGALGSAADWAKDVVVGGLQAAAKKAISSVIRPLIGRIPGGGVGSLMKGLSNKALDGILSYFGGQDKKAQQVDYKPGGGVAQWAPQIQQALQLLGQSSGWLGTVERRMNQESGGNPTAVNRNDINWQNGTPSVGLMQVIGPTFKAYAGQFRGTGPFMYGTSTAALPNIYAGLNYAMHRYGSLTALNRPGGYDSGGLLQPGATLAVNRTGRPERVLDAQQTAMFEHLVNGGGGGGVTIQAINVNGTFDFSSPASRRAAANALVKEMKEAIRLSDRSRA
jgi:SLT domain-containing protein/phage-related protein